MPDVFISYSSKDRDKVHLLAKALEKYSLNVWWDPEIKPGQAYRQVIQEALDSASCVIVVWSNESVKSMWVQAEASQAIERNLLIPVAYENVRIPMPFNGLQTANLEGWNGDLEDQKFKNLISGITLHCRTIKEPDHLKGNVKQRQANILEKTIRKPVIEQTVVQAKRVTPKKVEEKIKVEAGLKPERTIEEKENDTVELSNKINEESYKNKKNFLLLLPAPLYFITMYHSGYILDWTFIHKLLLLISILILTVPVYINRNTFHPLLRYTVYFLVAFEIILFTEGIIGRLFDKPINFIPDYVYGIIFSEAFIYTYPVLLLCISIYIFLKLNKTNKQGIVN